MNELFSVILTTCNREVRILKHAIDSVINQSYSNIEIIVINDSPNNLMNDEIKKLIDCYGNKIQYFINEKQMGANYSRNYGMRISKGVFLSFLDDDDYWDKTRIQKFVELLKNGYDIVYSDFYIFNNKKSRYSKRVNPEQKYALKTILSSNFMGGFSNVAFTRKCFVDSQMLDESMPSYQDQDLFIRMLKNGKIGYVGEGLSYYRITENSISLNSKKKLDGLTMLLSKYSELYKKYPDAKRIRLENELVYSAKQGWKNNKNEIKKLLKQYDSRIRISFLELFGSVKRIAVKIFKV